MGQRRRARERALQMLFQIDLTGSSPREVFDQFWAGQEAASEVRVFAERLVLGVAGERRGLDVAISGSASNWRCLSGNPTARSRRWPARSRWATNW